MVNRVRTTTKVNVLYQTALAMMTVMVQVTAAVKTQTGSWGQTGSAQTLVVLGTS